jgi:hypothetical protein
MPSPKVGIGPTWKGEESFCQPPWEYLLVGWCVRRHRSRFRQEALTALASRKELLSMASLKECHHDSPPVLVQWPLLYANKEFVGQGTLLNISHWGCQVAGLCLSPAVWC